MIRPRPSSKAFLASLLIGFFLYTPISGQEARPGNKQQETQIPAGETAEQAPDRLADSAEPSLGPDTVQATAAAEKRYEEIARNGGWPIIRTSSLHERSGRAVKTLRRRLAAEGDLPQDAVDDPQWGDDLSVALTKFQSRMGLPQTGELSKATLRELNVSATARARDLAATLRRLSGRHYRFERRYVLVNIPATQVEAVEDGKVVGRYAAIVGKSDHRSPELVTKITSIKVNPSWTVPVSIIKHELIPKLRRDRSYLSRIHMRVFDARGREINPRKIHWSKKKAEKYTFRQDPGEKNSLGALRISMPNKYDVYLHDTPKKALFARNYRFLSHGCVRVEDVYDLAAWLLRGARGSPSGQWDRQAILEEIDKGARMDIRLAHPVETIWVYMTGWATADGVAHFRHDIYHLDRKEEKRR